MFLSSSDLIVLVGGLILVAALLTLSRRELLLVFVTGTFMAVLVVAVATVVLVYGHPTAGVDSPLIGFACH